MKVGDLEAQKKDLERQRDKLAGRLEDEIQQNEYYMTKLDGMDVEMMEEKLQALTHLSHTQQRRIDTLTQ